MKKVKAKIYIAVVNTVYNDGETTTWCEAKATRFDALKSLIREMRDAIDRDHDYATSEQEFREDIRRAFDEGDEGETHNAVLKCKDFTATYDIWPDEVEIMV